MTCEACELMLSNEMARPHKGLLATDRPRKLRPLQGHPVSVQRYQCHVCGLNWLHEGTALTQAWICLFASTSVLDPAMDRGSSRAVRDSTDVREPEVDSQWLELLNRGLT
jgi:transposase-like protein